MRKIYVNKKNAIIADILLFVLCILGGLLLYVLNLEFLFYCTVGLSALGYFIYLLLDNRKDRKRIAEYLSKINQ